MYLSEWLYVGLGGQCIATALPNIDVLVSCGKGFNPLTEISSSCYMVHNIYMLIEFINGLCSDICP